MKIYFVSHGESEANLHRIISNRGLEHRLTSRDRRQVERLTNYLKRSRITHLYTSPISRAVETSEIIANHLKLDYVVYAAIRDFDCSILEGRSDDVAWQEWHRLKDVWLIEKQYGKHIEGGESYDDMRQRFLPFISELIEKHGHTQDGVVCVSHGRICSLMLPLMIKNVDEKAVDKYGFGYASCLAAELQPMGLTCIEWNGEAYPSKAA